jgi:hypothetical protein
MPKAHYNSFEKNKISPLESLLLFNTGRFRAIAVFCDNQVLWFFSNCGVLHTSNARNSKTCQLHKVDKDAHQVLFATNRANTQFDFALGPQTKPVSATELL